MNQILVSEKLYVTPALKRKKKFFKVEFILSIFLLCLLYSYYIYAEHDRNKSEEVSRVILENMEFVEPEVVDETIVVVLNSVFEEEEKLEEKILTTEEIMAEVPKEVSKDGIKYQTIGQINIPKVKINYPILSETSKELLKIGTCKFWGSYPNEVGNLCIVGHNYRDNKFFSKLPKLEKGDIVEITDITGNTLEYEIYDKFIIEPDDLKCTSQLTKGEKRITLITCTNSGKQRWVLQAKEKI